MGAQTRDASMNEKIVRLSSWDKLLSPLGKNNDNLIRSDQSAQECQSNYYRRETR